MLEWELCVANAIAMRNEPGHAPFIRKLHVAVSISHICRNSEESKSMHSLVILAEPLLLVFCLDIFVKGSVSI